VVELEQRVLSSSLGRRSHGHVHRRGTVSRDDLIQSHDDAPVQGYQRSELAVSLAVRAIVSADANAQSVILLQYQNRIPAPGPVAARLHKSAATRTVPSAALAGQGQPGRSRPDARDG